MAVQQVIIATKPHRPVDFNAKAVQAVLDDSYLIADVKEDGVRLNLCVRLLETQHSRRWSVDWLSREGKKFPALCEVYDNNPYVLTLGQPLDVDPRWTQFFGDEDHGLFPEGFMLDAELRIDDLPCKDIAGTLRRHEGIDLGRLKVIVFGILPMSAVRSGEPYNVTHSVMKYHAEYQVKLLQERFPEIAWSVVESLDVFNMAELDTLYASVRERKLEGLVLKDPNGIYKRSKQTGMWKMTPDDSEDGKVVGLVWGTLGLANEGKVIGFEVLLESGHVVNACKIGRAQMEEFTDTERRLPGYYMGHTVRVTFMERYPDGSLRHPSFDSFRGISEPTIKE